MKTNYLLFITVLVLSFSTLKAQFVTIPDANFKAYLQTTYPACFNGGGMLDTTCTEILNASILSPRSLSITDITGIQYFKNLHTLNCSNNQLSALPLLPNSLETIYCDTNQFSVFPSLSYQHLGFVSFNDNQLTTISSLASNIEILRCSYNQITSMVPSIAIAGLICDHNQLTSIASYPNLQQLTCNNNLLTLLPNFTNSPSNGYLSYLDCSNNQLTALPTLPGGVFTLKCSNNQLATLPTIYLDNGNTLDTLDCRNNLLNCMPFLPSTMLTLLASGNNIACLANIPSPGSGRTFTSDIGMNVCSVSDNPNNCSLTAGIKRSLNNEATLSLYPNPSKGLVSIASSIQGSGALQIKVLNTMGMEVLSMNVTNLDNTTIDLSEEPSGIYYVQLIIDQQVISRKLILEV